MKTNMDTQNDGLEKVTPFKRPAIFGIYVRFLGCTSSNGCFSMVMLVLGSVEFNTQKFEVH